MIYETAHDAEARAHFPSVFPFLPSRLIRRGPAVNVIRIKINGTEGNYVKSWRCSLQKKIYKPNQVSKNVYLFFLLEINKDEHVEANEGFQNLIKGTCS